MSTSAPEPGDSVRPAQPAIEQDAARKEAACDRELFDQVLEETRSALGGDQLDSVGTEVFRAVAHRHRGCRLDVDPVMKDLVQAVLKHRFPRLWKQDTFWTAMSRQIAETLWEDPRSRERLQAFWERLTGALR